MHTSAFLAHLGEGLVGVRRLASEWVREQKLETALPNPPKITSGEVVAQEVSELVQA